MSQTQSLVSKQSVCSENVSSEDDCLCELIASCASCVVVARITVDVYHASSL